MRTPEEIAEDIMSTMDYYVSRWMDREGAKKDLIKTLREELTSEKPTESDTTESDQN